MSEAAPQAARGDAGPGSTADAETELSALLGDVTLEMLKATFDHWTIGAANGRLWAFRSGTFAAEGPESLKRGCVMADTATGLAEQLCVQAWLEALPADDLEAVWREGAAAVRP